MKKKKGVQTKKHGTILEKAIRDSGYPITALARKLNISRNTIYQKFKADELDFDFIRKIGSIIQYDFSIDIPELSESNYGTVPSHAALTNQELASLKENYTTLLEAYSTLLRILIKTNTENNLALLKKEIQEFLKKATHLPTNLPA